MRHHLVVLQESYLEAILAGQKTVECRLMRGPCQPYRNLRRGDLLWLKQSCGPVRGVAAVERAEHMANLDHASIRRIHQTLNRCILAPTEFYQQKADARYATLIWLGHICPLRPFEIRKSDRQAWVMLARPPLPNRALTRARPRRDRRHDD